MFSFKNISLKNHLIILCIISFLLLDVFCQTEELENSIDELNNSVNSLNNAVSNLSNDVRDLGNDLEDTQASLKRSLNFYDRIDEFQESLETSFNNLNESLNDNISAFVQTFQGLTLFLVISMSLLIIINCGQCFILYNITTKE